MYKAPFLYCTRQHLLFVFLIIAILIDMRWDLNVLLLWWGLNYISMEVTQQRACLRKYILVLSLIILLILLLCDTKGIVLALTVFVSSILNWWQWQNLYPRAPRKMKCPHCCALCSKSLVGLVLHLLYPITPRSWVFHVFKAFWNLSHLDHSFVTRHESSWGTEMTLSCLCINQTSHLRQGSNMALLTCLKLRWSVSQLKWH